jgi:Zn-dependent protease
MDPITTLFLAITFVISISLHEYAHAWSSYKLGDPTPKIQGRLTPNPLVHIDPLGFILIFIIHFGRGRPVIVNPAYYKNKLRDELLVALAGPAMNIVLAILGTIIMFIYVKIVGIQSLIEGDIVIQFRKLFGWINIALAVFNMIPIYPLDGYRIVKYLRPKVGYAMEQYRKYILIGLLALIFLPNLLGLPFDPISSIIINVSQTVYAVIQTSLSVIFF